MVNTLKKGLIKRSIIYKKKGLSEIIATLVTILLVLVAVGIVWGVIKNVIKNQTEQISLGKLTLDIEIKKASIINESFAQVSIKRNPGEGDFKSIKVIFDDGEETEIIEIKESLTELQEKTYLFELKSLNASELEKISIAPVFIMESGKEIIGEVKDEHKIKQSTVSSCTPNCSGKNCGSNGCGGNCGTCSSGYTCNSTGQCVIVAGCTPGTCVGKNCGSWANGTCSGTLNCGTCSSGYTCNSTGQCISSTPSWQNGMISWWKLDGNAQDSIGTNHGTVNGATLTSTGCKAGQCYSFDGVNDYISTPFYPGTTSLGQKFSWGIWKEYNSFIANTGSSGSAGSSPRFYTQITGTSGQLRASFGDSYWDATVLGTGNLNKMVFILFVFDEGTLYTYINGTLANTHSEITFSGDSATPFSLGRGYDSARWHNGLIDEIMIWNRALNSTEAQQIYTYSY